MSNDNNQLQNDEYYLPGNLGSVTIGGEEHEIIKAESNYQNGSLTLTFSPPKDGGIQEILLAKGFQMISRTYPALEEVLPDELHLLPEQIDTARERVLAKIKKG